MQFKKILQCKAFINHDVIVVPNNKEQELHAENILPNLPILCRHVFVIIVDDDDVVVVLIKSSLNKESV